MDDSEDPKTRPAAGAALVAALALVGPFAAFAALGGAWNAGAFAEVNRWTELGREHIARSTWSADVLRSSGLLLLGALPCLVALWLSTAIGWLRARRHGVALFLAGLLACWVVLVLESPRSWTVARVRDGIAWPNLLWRLLPTGGDPLPPGAAGVFATCGAMVGAGVVLALVVGRSARIRGWRWPGPVWRAVGGACALVSLALCVFAWVLPRYLEPAPPPAVESVLYLTWDSTRADRLSTYGHERETTPHVDAFAADSVLFERAYANHNWTRPSYMTTLTGKPGWEVDIKRLRYAGLTLAEVMKDAGFATRAFVQNPNLDFSFRMDQGFDRYLQFTEDAPPAEVATWAVRAIDELAGTPFFLFVHIEQPHWPYVTGGKFVDPGVDPDDPPVPTWVIEKLLAEHELEHWDADAPDAGARLEFLFDSYDSDIADADTGLGTILDALRERGLYDDALILFNSDHGDEFFEHGNFGHAHRNLFQELTRIPLVVHFPASLGVAPRRSDQIVQNLDLFPTIVDVLDLPPVDGLVGRSLLELLAEPRPDRAILSTFNGLVAVRTRTHTLVRDFRREQPPVLYDVADDPNEGEPVADVDAVADYPALAGLAEWWGTECWDDRETDAPGDTEGMSPELIQRLDALGYLGE